ncbi:MAG TPA: hypothetical protein VFG83_09485 [Kofleriaceae bacterium]|nr:hypothetical protein [Kofleriaceae bacterium]
MPHRLDETFRRLGDDVESRWRATTFDEDAFAEIARSMLCERCEDLKLDPISLLRWVTGAPRLPHQRNLSSKFGEPPICVYENERFYIELLFWLDGTTTIHEHAFVGAFTVVSGSSIHTRYRFQEREAVSPQVKLGEVTFENAELLRAGDSRAIVAGPAFIHALFHLDRPSVSMVVRTSALNTKLPQLQYLPPALGIDPFCYPEATRRRIEALRALLKLHDESALDAATDIIDHGDLLTAYHVIDQWLALRGDNRGLSQLLERATRRLGGQAAALEAMVTEEARKRNLIARRQLIRNPEHRFLLALLLNLPDRATILDAVAQRYPEEEPVAKVVRWIGDMLCVRPDDPDRFGDNLLGLPAGPATRDVCDGLLRGRTESEIVRESSAPAAEVIKRCLTIPRARILAPLFT